MNEYNFDIKLESIYNVKYNRTGLFLFDLSSPYNRPFTGSEIIRFCHDLKKDIKESFNTRLHFHDTHDTLFKHGCVKERKTNSWDTSNNKWNAYPPQYEYSTSEYKLYAILPSNHKKFQDISVYFKMIYGQNG